MYFSYQILVLFIFLFVIASIIRGRIPRIVFSLMGGLFFVFEIVAVYMTGKLIDYRFYTHINLNSLYAHGFQFETQIILFVVLFVMTSILLYYGSKKYSYYLLNKFKISVPIISVAFILLSLPNSVFSEIYKVYEILDTKDVSFNKALSDLGISPEQYVTPDQLSAIKGKNIIVISLESVEQGFLGPNFDGLTPNLNSLSKEWTFYNKMPVGPGGSWTSGSLYNHQVGMPAFFKGQVNQVFQGTSNVKLTGLGHVLNKAGYDSKYLIGDEY